MKAEHKALWNYLSKQFAGEDDANLKAREAFDKLINMGLEDFNNEIKGELLSVSMTDSGHLRIQFSNEIDPFTLLGILEKTKMQILEKTSEDTYGPEDLDNLFSSNSYDA